MGLKAILHKLLRRFARADVTRMLLLDTRSFVASKCPADVMCASLDAAQLRELASLQQFSVTQAFIDDFGSHRFSGVAARLGNKVVGLCFLAENRVPNQYNRGGEAFRGIGVSLPPTVQFLFKVEVRPEWRGRRIHSAMIRHAIEKSGTRKLRAIVTTTHWRNTAFLASAYRQGFKAGGYAAEFVIAGTRLYHLPKPLDALASSDSTGGSALPIRVVTFHGEQSIE